MADVTQQSLDLTNLLSQANTKLNDTINKLVESVGKLSTLHEKLGQNASKVSDVIKNSAPNVNNLSKQYEESSSKISDFISKIGQQKISLESLTDEINKNIKGNENLINAFSNGIVTSFAYIENINHISQSLKALNASSSQSSELMAHFGETASSAAQKALSKFGEHGKVIADSIRNFYDGVAAARTLETSLIQAATAGGNVSAVLSQVGKGGISLSSDLDATMEGMIKRVERFGIEAGVGPRDAMNAVMEVMKKMPGEIGEKYTITLGESKKFAVTTEQLLAKVAAGTGVALNDAMKIAESMIGDFGKNAEGAARRLSVISKVSKDLSIPLGDVEGLTSKLDQSFSMWGDQAEKTVPILNNVSRALQGTSIGFKGQIKLVEELATSVSRMELGMKSFIGVQSGLRGSAVGAGLQIERMMQEGRMDEIVNMMQKTIEQRTGRKAITLAEATETPGAEGVFMQQRALLQSMTKISDVGTLNRLLETMSKGPLVGGAVDATKELEAALTEGQTIQNRQRDDTAAIAENTKEAVSLLSAIKQYQAQRAATGTTEAGERFRTLAEREAAGGTTMTTTKEFAPETVQALAKTVPATTANIFKGLSSVIIGEFSNITEAIKKDRGTEATPLISSIDKELKEKLNQFSTSLGISAVDRKKILGKYFEEPTETRLPTEEAPKKLTPSRRLPEETPTPVLTIPREQLEGKGTTEKIEHHLMIHILDKMGNQLETQKIVTELSGRVRQKGAGAS